MSVTESHPDSSQPDPSHSDVSGQGTGHERDGARDSSDVVSGDRAVRREARKNQLHAVHDASKSAGIVSRGVGAVIDLIVVLVIMSAIYLGVVMARLLYNVHDFSMPSTNGFFTIGAFIVVSIVYLASCWAVSGRTLGSVVMGIRVVNRKGNRLRPTIAVLRSVICVFFAIGLLWVGVDSRRRSVADVLLRTRVVYSR